MSITNSRFANDIINPRLTLVPDGKGQYFVQSSTVIGYTNGSTITESAMIELQSKGVICLITESNKNVDDSKTQLLFG